MNPAGPKYGSTTGQSAGGVSWTNLSNALVEDAAVATCGAVGPGGGGGIANQLRVTGMSFNIPSTAIIDGIKLEAKVQTSGGVNALDSGVSLASNAGDTATANTPNSGQFWPASLTWLTWGSSTSLWGRAWTPADINHANFGASLAAFPGTGTASINVDSVRITVYWHTAPADVPKRYLYKVYSAAGQYLGNLPNVISEFTFSQDINTAGGQITIEVGQSADTASLPGSHILTEAGDFLTDEAGNRLITEGQPPIISAGNATDTTLIRNGNQVVVYEYSYYYPNGIAMFSGQMNRWAASFGGNQDSIVILCYSDGQDLDNYIARGSPFSYTLDQTQTSQNASDTISNTSGKLNSYNNDGQTFTVGAGVSNIGAISIMLNGSANVTVSLYSSPTSVTPLATSTQLVSVTNPTEIQFGFPNSITAAPGGQYFFSVSVDDNQSILIYYSNANPYSGGTMYNQNYGGAGGGSWSAQAANDLYFKSFSSAGSTTATYTTVDPSTGMLQPIVDDYRARGGLINYATGTVDATALSLSYTFNTNTIYEALKAILTLAPNGFYYWVDLGLDILYFKQTATTADFTLTKGKHINDLTLISSIENMKNQLYFSGGATAGVNLYKTYLSNTSIGLYGVRLERQSDNRVVVTPTADAIGNSFIATNKNEQYQTTVTILDKTMDITLLTPGKVIGFNGFGTFVDRVTAQIVRREYHADYVTLTLGILPKRLNPAVEAITRGLIAQQTIANPTAPS